MFSVSQLIKKYDLYSFDELLDIYVNIDSYSPEAKEALTEVMQKKGGLEALKKYKIEKDTQLHESERIKAEVAKLAEPEVDITFLKKIITSKILSPKKLDEVIEAAFFEKNNHYKDTEIKQSTITGSVFGGIAASIIGGILWGLQLIYSKRVFLLLTIGLVLLCYGIIKWSTKQSAKNNVVFIATFISVLIAAIIGYLLYSIVGYQE